MLFTRSQNPSIPLGNQFSSIHVNGVWMTHGCGWQNMLTLGGVDQTIMIHGISPDLEQLPSLNTMQT